MLPQRSRLLWTLLQVIDDFAKVLLPLNKDKYITSNCWLRNKIGLLIELISWSGEGDSRNPSLSYMNR